MNTNSNRGLKPSSLFVPKLAKAVQERIDADVNKAPKSFATFHAKAMTAQAVSEISAQSVATLWAGDRLWAKLESGKFDGQIRLIWNGMDDFIYEIDPKKPFSFTRSDGTKIAPRLMETDGGSIPRILRGMSKFSSWGYAPAFIIHDWLFTAHKCGYDPDNQWAFDDTATIMAEAIKTLMEVGYTNYAGNPQMLAKAEDTLYLMYQAVASFVAKNLWDDATSVTCLV